MKGIIFEETFLTLLRLENAPAVKILGFWSRNGSESIHAWTI